MPVKSSRRAGRKALEVELGNGENFEEPQITEPPPVEEVVRNRRRGAQKQNLNYNEGWIHIEYN